jgi:hypothetical protein
MNGISFNKPIQDDPSGSFLDQVKKNEDNKKRKNLKMVAILVFSNIFVAYLSYSPQKLSEQIKQTPVLISHAGYRTLILNIIPLLQVDNSVTERKITLLNNKKKIVLALGYLHEELKNDLDPSIRRFKIEIPEQQILEMGAFSEEKLIAIPAIEVTKAKSVSRGSTYEINI